MRALLLVFVAACGTSKSQEAQPQPSPTTPSAQPSAPTPIADSGTAAAPVAPPTPSAPTPAPPPVDKGHDFIAEAKLLYRVAGCADGPLPEAFANAKFEKVIAKHCKAIAPHVEKFRDAYFVKGKDWLAKHIPAGIPSTVVYPFGGGDLLSAISVFPAAKEITTISLEQSGDPRTINNITPQKLDTELAKFRTEVEWLIKFGSNTSVNLSAQQRSALPGQVTSFLLGLAIAGYEPVSLRYFRIDDKGAIHYYTKAEIEADTKDTKSLSGQWNKPSFAASFRNVELGFKKLGSETVQTHRHVAWNLGDKELAAEPGLLVHLKAKGKVTIIVKGASYLLWLDNFQTMRKYILEHLAFMLSDSTAIPPMWAEPAGMTLEPWGKFVKPGLPHAVGLKADHDMRALWKKSVGPAPFRFGYIDSNNNHHLLITKPKT